MTRAEAYEEGFQEGRRVAEEDIRAHARQEPMSTDREGWLESLRGENRADEIGYMRGYRDTWARWDAGTLTWEMLEHAPVNR